MSSKTIVACTFQQTETANGEAVPIVTPEQEERNRLAQLYFREALDNGFTQEEAAEYTQQMMS